MRVFAVCVLSPSVYFSSLFSFYGLLPKFILIFSSGFPTIVLCRADFADIDFLFAMPWEIYFFSLSTLAGNFSGRSSLG